MNDAGKSCTAGLQGPWGLMSIKGTGAVALFF